MEPSKKLRAALALLGILLLPATAAGAPAPARLEGTISDAAGEPLPEYRVIARAAEGAEVYVSAPSDDQGHYALEVPGDTRYVLLALIAPAGGRMELPEAAPFLVGRTAVTRDIKVPAPVAPASPGAAREGDGVDRFFLAFAEDPALIHDRHFEVQLDHADVDFAESTVVRGIAAFQFKSLPRVEVGGRLGYGDLQQDGGADGSGPTDLDLWAKFQLYRSADSRTDVAFGSVVTLPTGDSDEGLGNEAFQSKVFVGVSRAWAPVLLVAHGGLATAEHGESFGTRYDGKVAPAAGLGMLVPVRETLSAVFEARYEGERFDGARADTRLLGGVNWRLGERGTLRLAAAVGIGETSDLVEIVAGYVFAY